MTVNKEEPRIQTYIAVRSGGKNDPHETTGLAHYFEHLMFKGTEQFGTQDYEAEKPCWMKSSVCSRNTAQSQTPRSATAFYKNRLCELRGLQDCHPQRI